MKFWPFFPRVPPASIALIGASLVFAVDWSVRVYRRTLSKAKYFGGDFFYQFVHRKNFPRTLR